MACFSGAESQSTSRAKTGVQEDWLNKALGVYGPQIGTGQPSYPGQQVAEFTPTQKAALGGAEGFLGAFTPDRPMPMYGETGTALKGILGGETGAETITPQMTSDYFKRVFQQPAARQFSEFTRPLIREEYAGPGFWGSARAKAVTKAGQEMGDWLGEQRGGLEWQAGEANRAIQEAKAGRAFGAIPMGMEYGRQPTQEATARLAGRQGVFGFAGAEQQQQQTLINSAIQKFKEGQRLTDPEVMNIVMGLLGLSFSTATSTAQGPGLGYNIAGSLAQGYASGMAG